MSDNKVYPVPQSFADSAHADKDTYEAMYKQSVENPDEFWAEQAEKTLDWFKPWDTVQEWDCLLYTSPSPRDGLLSRMPSSA